MPTRRTASPPSVVCPGNRARSRSREMVDDICRRCCSAAEVDASRATLYAYALLGAGRYEEALGEFEAYVRVAPREPNPFDSLGEAYLVMGAPDRAVESYSRALTIDPTFAGSHIGRAWSLASLGRYDDAIRRGAAAVPAGQLVVRQGARSFARRQISRGRPGHRGRQARSRNQRERRGAGERVPGVVAPCDRARAVRARAARLRLGRTHVREFAREEKEGRPRAGSPDERDRAGQGRPHRSSSFASRDAGTAVQLRRRTRELVAQRVGRRNRVGRWRPREGGVRFFRRPTLEKDVVQHPSMRTCRFWRTI